MTGQRYFKNANPCNVWRQCYPLWENNGTNEVTTWSTNSSLLNEEVQSKAAVRCNTLNIERAVLLKVGSFCLYTKVVGLYSSTI